MPSTLNETCKTEWISSEIYEKANKYITEFDKTVHIKSEDANTLCMYFISRSQMVSEEKHEKKISPRLVRQFEATLAGNVPRGTSISNWQRIVKKSFALAKVYVALDPVRQVLECKANPLNLMCLGCIGYHQKGICTHVLAATHIYYAQLRVPEEEKPMQHNLKYMCSKLYGKTGRRPKRRPWNAAGGLQRDNDPHADEEDQVNANRHTWW